MSVGGKRSIRAVTLDLDDTLWPCEPTLVRAERLALEWLTERVPEVIAPWSIDRMRERRMAIHAARPELKHDFRTLRRVALEEVFREAGADDVQSAPIIEGSLDIYMTARNHVELYPEVRACLERLSARYRIASLSNGNACWLEHCNRYRCSPCSAYFRPTSAGWRWVSSASTRSWALLLGPRSAAS